MFKGIVIIGWAYLLRIGSKDHGLEVVDGHVICSSC